MRVIALVLALLAVVLWSLPAGALSVNGGSTLVINGGNPPIVSRQSPSQAPGSICSTNSVTSAFSCDLTFLGYGIPYTITGAATLGQPTSGYTVTPNLSAIYSYLSNSSGFNNSTSGNGSGRTGAQDVYIKVDNLGQGDAFGIYGNIFVNGAKPSATSFLANPAGTILGGQVLAGQAGVYLQPIGDLNCDDQGFDVACIGGVFNLKRSVNTGALGATWVGLRVQSKGADAADAAFSATGPITMFMDPVDATVSAVAAASADQKWYGNSTNAGSNKYPATVSLGTEWWEYDATKGWLFDISSADVLSVTSSVLTTPDVIKTTGGSISGYSAGTAFIYGDATNGMVEGGDGSSFDWTLAVSKSGSGPGSGFVVASVAHNSGTMVINSLQVTNNVLATLFETSTALITATGASTASFLTNGVGGTGGPTTATQNGWVKMLDSTGATIWVPVWK